MRLELHKILSDGTSAFIQPLTFIPEVERAGYLQATYGKRAGLFFIQEARPLSAAVIRAMDERDWRDIGRPSAPVASAASAIIGKLAERRD